MFRKPRRRSIKGEMNIFLIAISPAELIVSSPPFLRASPLFNRYIDQCQELLDAPATLGERKDLEVYALAVQTAKSDAIDYWLEDVPKDYISYVERSSTQYLDDGKQALPVSFNYERWLGGVS